MAAFAPDTKTASERIGGAGDGRCPICVRPRSSRYVNEAAGEACIHPCHWPYLSADGVAAASIALDKIKFVNGDALRNVWA